MGGTFVNPVDSHTDVKAIVDDTKKVVTDRFAEAMKYADGTMNMAGQFLNELSGAAGSFGYSSFYPTLPTIDPLTYDFNIGTAPSEPVLSLTIPALPDWPDLELIAIDAVSIPTLDAVEPSITLPVAPSSDLPNPPDQIPVASDLNIPTKPVVTLPDPPTFHDVTIPEIPIANFPAFTATAPVESLVVPGIIVDIVNDTYTSAIKTALQDTIYDGLVNGGTGIDTDVEALIWNRNLERNLLALEDAKIKVAEEWSKHGFSLPDGVLVSQLTQIDTEYLNKRLDISRDIAIKQADLAYQYAQTIIQQGVALENILIGFANQVAERTFQSTKALQEAAINIFNASVAKYSAQIETYKVQAVVYDTLIRGEIGKAEFFKAAVAAAQVTADVNRSLAEVYRIRISAVSEIINLYRVEMEVAKIQSDIDRNKIEVFRAQIDAYIARVNAKSSEFNMYRSKIDGEKAKVEIYASQVGAYKARVEGSQAEASIKIEQAKAKIAYNQSLIERYRADLDGYRTRVQALVEEMNAEAKLYDTGANIYRSKADAQAAIARVDVSAQEAAIRALLSNMQIGLSAAEMNIKSYQAAAQLRVEAAKGGAAVAAQLASGIFSGVSVQAHISGAGSVQKSYGGREDLSETHTYKEK